MERAKEGINTALNALEDALRKVAARGDKRTARKIEALQNRLYGVLIQLRQIPVE